MSTILVGCSRDVIMRMMTKSPKLESYSVKDFPHYNDYQLALEYLRRFIKAAYPRLENKISMIALDSIIQEQINRVQNANDDEFDLSLNKIMASLQDVHSCYQVNYKKIDDSFFYLNLMFEDGYWYIHNVDDSKPQTLIGSKIVELNGMDADSLDKLIQLNVCGETNDSKRWAYINRQRFPTFLKQVGILKNQNEITIKYSNKDGTHNDTIHSKPNGKYHDSRTKKYDPNYLYKQNDGFYYTIDSIRNFAYFQMNTSLDYVAIKSELTNYTSFLLRPIVKAYLKKQKKEAMDFGKKVALFFRELEGNGIKNVILDLSYNGGGDERLGKQFLWYLNSAHNKQISGFTDYVMYSEYFKEMVSKEASKVEHLHRLKYGDSPQLGTEINMTKLLDDDAYFNDITKTDGKFYLDSTVGKFSGQLYVITSQYTNSAAQVLATTIVDNDLGEVVGLPPGNTPTTQTGALMFKLPNTRKVLSLSYYYMERPDKTILKREELQLDKIIYQKYRDRLDGKNTVFEYIISRING